VPDSARQSRARAAVGLLLAGLALATLACARPADEPPEPARTPTPLDTATTGTIAGTVRFTGPVPPPTTVTVTSDPVCAALHPRGLAVEEVRVADGALADAFVWLRSGLGTRVFAVPETPVEIDQRGCTYVPHVAGAQVGQPVRFINSDATLHNVHGTPTRSAPWNFGLAFAGADRRLTLPAAELMVGLRCDVHPWMRGYLGVLEHPYYAVTGTDGRFTLANVPPGTYVLAAWHERLGTREQTVVVPAQGRVAVDLGFTAPP
jgi:plastocyanin